jgi:serine/threonine-protein kinase
MNSEPAGKGVRRLRIGRYQVVAHLATGGMGAVYRAVDLETGRPIALKILAPELAGNPVMLARFRREAEHATRVHHDNIVHLYEWGEDKGVYFLALEFIEGIDLQDYIKEQGRLDFDLALAIIIQAARALAHLHQLGIVHRDIKPSNFLLSHVDGRPVVKLIDLGLARDANDESFRLTRAAHTLGTVDYMSPEQARDSGRADIRSDLYSLGCTWFHLLAGEPPFPHGSMMERLHAHDKDPPPDVREVNPGVTPWGYRVLTRLLAKDPADRYPMPAALLWELEAGERAAHETGHVLSGLTDPAGGRPAWTGWGGEEQGVVTAPAEPPARDESAPRPRRPARARERGALQKPPREREPEPSRRPVLFLWGAVGAAVIGTLFLVALWVTSGTTAQPTTAEPPADRQAVPVRPGATHRAPEPHAAQEHRREVGRAVSSAQRSGPQPPTQPVAPGLPSLYQPLVAIDAVQLRREFERPSPILDAAPDPAALYRVSRFDTGGPGRHFASLEAACAAAPAGHATVIEVRDNGPLFVPALTLRGARLLIRGATGYRPLLAWDAPASRGRPPSAFLAVQGGDLALENLEVVWRAIDTGQAERSALVRVTDGTLAARGCTFSVAGTHHRGVAAVQLDEGTAARPGHCNCRLDHCYLRGTELIAVAAQASAADVLVDHCLVVGGDRPLLDLTVLSDQAQAHVRLRRSTLVGRQEAIHVQVNRTQTSVSAVDCTAWDTLLACSDDQPGGAMVGLDGGNDLRALHWRAVNCYYAGWQALLRSDTRTVTALSAWRQLFGYREGDLATPRSWPPLVHHELAEGVAAEYATAGTHAAFAATSGPGALGCDVRQSPPARASWLRCSYERFLPAALDLPRAQSPVDVPAVRDNRYHGGEVDCERVDLGAHLQLMHRLRGLGSRVVLRLVGRGRRPTSPVRVRGSTLVLDFGPVQDSADDPLTLVPQRHGGGGAALVDVEGGDLVMLGGRLRLPAEVRDAPAHLLRVHGGHLVLAGCRLDGALARPPAGYKGLVEFHGSGDARPPQARGCALTDCVLTSGRECLHCVSTGAQIQLTNCVVVAAGDALVFEPRAAPGGRLNVSCQLEHCTFALKRAAVYLAETRAGDGVEPLVVQATANVFTDPFSDAPREAGLLLCEGDALGRGLLAWQGRGNAYDVQRLAFYARPAAARSPRRKQSYAVWKRLWGSQGEVQPVLKLDWSRTFSLDAPKLGWLVLPVRRSTEFTTPPGADLVQLGLVKKPMKSRL